MVTNKNIMKKLFLVVFCFALVACSGTKKVRQSETKTEIKCEKIISYRDTIITVPASKTSLKVPITEFQKPFTQPKTITNKNGNATAKLTIGKDTVSLSAECDSLAIRAQIRQELIKEFERTSEKTDTEIKKGVSTLQMIINCLLALLVGVVLGIILKIFLI